jgi:Tol biopolymer transport system component
LRFLIACPHENSARVLDIAGSASAQEQHQNKTHFNDYEVSKASNPVISTDGRFMAFQTAKAGDPAGVGVWDPDLLVQALSAAIFSIHILSHASADHLLSAGKELLSWRP